MINSNVLSVSFVVQSKNNIVRTIQSYIFWNTEIAIVKKHSEKFNFLHLINNSCSTC